MCEEKAPCDKMEVQVLERDERRGAGEEDEAWGRKTASISTPSERAEGTEWFIYIWKI